MSNARVSPGQVTEIIETSLTDSVIESNMIDTAHVYVETHLADYGHSESMLEKIELYLAAHFVALTEEGGNIKLSKTGDATDEWDTSHLGKGLGSTRFGQTALSLDSSGLLANVGSGSLKAEFRVV